MEKEIQGLGLVNSYAITQPFNGEFRTERAREMESWEQLFYDSNGNGSETFLWNTGGGIYMEILLEGKRTRLTRMGDIGEITCLTPSF